MSDTPLRGTSLGRRLGGWFVRGLLITAPAGLTLWVTWALITWLDGLLGIGIPGVGLVAALLIITGIGALASSYATRTLVGLLDDLLERLPFVRLLYTSAKDLLGAFVGEKRRFRQAVRVALDDTGSVSVLGFVTAESLADLGLPGQIAVYLPQSYNFAGQLLVVPAARVTPLAADSAEVMAFVVSGGVSRTSGRSG
jgi:uncharacterized membrane protein